jgi:uncharacterized protein
MAEQETPDAVMPPRYVTCPCQYCSGRIEFDANQLDTTANTTVPCPHCGLETIIFVPVQKVPPVISPPNAYEDFQSLLERAQRGDCESQYLLGIAYFTGAGVSQNGAEALKWVSTAAEHGYPKAQYELGALNFANGSGNINEAVKWYRLAAEQGNADAQFALGAIYGFGQSVPKDSAESVKWYRMAAEQGHPTAQTNLGWAYDCGEGVPKDKPEAVKWYRLAADNGDARAQFVLGLAYALGEGVSEDHAESAKWHRKAAEQGLADAQLLMGLNYSEGDGVPKDNTEAVKWFSLAAAQGDARAQFHMGLACDSGEEVAKDCTEAVKWYHMAAEQGCAEAQHNLGCSYSKGEGVPQDFVEAYKWANLAAAQNLESAKNLRDFLVQQMTPSQIEEGQRQSSIEASKIRNPASPMRNEKQARVAIPSEVRREVWRRDGGRCVKCGSRENLEYDHILPVSKGGGNTARNIELLCETCNRAKSNLIQ